ncbi:MAG: hypothetical protein ACI9QC_000940 [Oceanicoccus sp.]|jgi:hypothetical protein
MDMSKKWLTGPVALGLLMFSTCDIKSSAESSDPVETQLIGEKREEVILEVERTIKEPVVTPKWFRNIFDYWGLPTVILPEGEVNTISLSNSLMSCASTGSTACFPLSGSSYYYSCLSSDRSESHVPMTFSISDIHDGSFKVSIFDGYDYTDPNSNIEDYELFVDDASGQELLSMVCDRLKTGTRRSLWNDSNDICEGPDEEEACADKQGNIEGVNDKYINALSAAEELHEQFAYYENYEVINPFQVKIVSDSTGNEFYFKFLYDSFGNLRIYEQKTLAILGIMGGPSGPYDTEWYDARVKTILEIE